MLARTEAVHGGTTYLASEPPLKLHRDVLYVPKGFADPGLYDRDGCMLAHAGVWRGVPKLHLHDGTARITLPRDAPSYGRSDRPMAFVGPITAHYGHFLLSNFSRLWNWRAASTPRPRLLHLGPAGAAAAAFAIPAVSDMLGCVGFAQADMLAFDRPTWLDEVLVAAPSFIENHVVCEAFGRLGRQVGNSLLDAVPCRAGPPVFLSKQSLAHGVSRVTNDAAFCAALAEAGIEIVCPEQLGLAQQAALFRDRPLVAAWIGSALHTSLFAAPARLLILNYEPVIWSNQKLIDAVCGNTSDYMHPTEGIERLATEQAFGNNYVLQDPRRLARHVARAIAEALR